MNDEKTERNLEIYIKRLGGAKFTDLAVEYGISNPRVAQIFYNEQRNQERKREQASRGGVLTDQTPVRIAGFRAQLVYALAWCGYKTVGDVRELSDDELRRCPGIGQKSIDEIRRICGPSTYRNPVVMRLPSS